MPRPFLAVLLLLGSTAIGHAEGSRPGAGGVDSGTRAAAPSASGTVVVHFGMGARIGRPDIPVDVAPGREAVEVVTVVRGTGGDDGAGEEHDHLARALAELCGPALPDRDVTAAAVIGASF